MQEAANQYEVDQILELLLYFKIEDDFNCSGMCKTGLFYFTKDI
jgi:hypothetical protein